MATEMTIRFTSTGKWQDLWYQELPPEEKLLFNYLCDNCDIAGFWEVNLPLAAFATKIPADKIEGAFKGLSKSYLVFDRHIWLKNFLYHQRNLPLTPEKNPSHRGILRLINSHNSFSEQIFKEIERQGATKGLQNPLCKSNSKGKGKSKVFVPPSLKEIEDYIKQNNYQVNAKTFYKFFTEANPPWTDSTGKPVLSWKQKIITWSGSRNNPERIIEHKKITRLCSCGCGKEAHIQVSSKWYASTECRKKVEGW
jgi:hypothetical protein